jgi:hypothetical protein
MHFSSSSEHDTWYDKKLSALCIFTLACGKTIRNLLKFAAGSTCPMKTSIASSQKTKSWLVVRFWCLM